MVVVVFTMCGWIPCFSVKPEFLDMFFNIALEALAKAYVCGLILYVEFEH